MMDSYQLPRDLDNEIARLEELIGKYKRGEIQAAELKAHRVPFGVYEQREPNTYMVRIRCAAGIITPSQLEQVAVIATEYGVDTLHITTRQELQIHYVKLDDLISVIRALKEIGLATRGGGGNTVRNIVAQDDAGIDPQEEFDVTPYAIALTTRLIEESDSWNLPRKFKIAFSGSLEDKGYATLADLGFIAQVKNSTKGFKVYVAGGLGAKPEIAKLLLDFIDAQEVYLVAKAVKNIFWKYGNRKNKHAARLRFLWQSLGEEEFKKRFSGEYAAIKKAGFMPLAVAALENKTISSGLVQDKSQNSQDFILWKSRFVKPQKQAGLFSVLIPVRLGFIVNEQAVKLAQFLGIFGDNGLRMTKEQNFLLRNIPQEYLGKVYNFLKNNLENFNPPVIFGKILSCAGASTCQLGICLSRQAAYALIRALDKSNLDLDRIGDIKLNISGCPNSCGQHPAADIGFFGKASRKDGRLYPAYNVVAGAVVHNGQTKLAEIQGEVSAKDLPALVEDLLARYLSPVNSYKNFQDYIAGVGREDLKQLFTRYQEIPDFDQDKDYYLDWGSDKIFSLADRRSGECSAGIFDLIEVDLDNIRQTREKINAAGSDLKQRIGYLAKLVFYASRMLLVTRGVEPKNEIETYEVFLRHFIDTGIVEESFRGLIQDALSRDYQAILKKEDEVYHLAQKVEYLYENMDNGFNFKMTEAPITLKEDAVSFKESQGRDTPVLLKDLRGITCPLNFVKTKVELSKLNSGEVLEIWLDDGDPIENVPGSVRAEGHEVISQKKIEAYWSVLIRKK